MSFQNRSSDSKEVPDLAQRELRDLAALELRKRQLRRELANVEWRFRQLKAEIALKGIQVP